MHVEWEKLLKEEMEKEYFLKLQENVLNERKSKTIYPPQDLVFSAFNMSPEDVRVVILGQDPYHGANQAHGMSFSVLPGIKPPPSLKNIYKEITAEFGYPMPKENGYLMPWAEQGVFLLNSVLTVQESNPNSHKDFGWSQFTDKVISLLSDSQNGLVFMLWGSFSMGKSNLIDSSKHLVLQSAHPSPFSARRGFFGNNHFIKANEYIREKSGSDKEIDWSINGT